MVTPFLILSVILVVVQWMVFAVLKANDAADDGTANASSMSLSTLQFTLHTPLGVVATNIATLIFHYRATDAWPVWVRADSSMYMSCWCHGPVRQRTFEHLTSILPLSQPFKYCFQSCLLVHAYIALQ